MLACESGAKTGEERKGAVFDILSSSPTHAQHHKHNHTSTYIKRAHAKESSPVSTVSETGPPAVVSVIGVSVGGWERKMINTFFLVTNRLSLT